MLGIHERIPVSEATSEEARDYVVYFCGLECHEKWTSQQGGKEKQD
ncbi:MAG TPA: DUF3330 domain-containing protein [Gammaproteobacteria bacterium]|nr:DUF3330 domain-containing protein [Gammaproteobacteria bacterium]